VHEDPGRLGRGPPTRASPSECRLDPGEELGEADRLGDVVVGAGEQPADAIGLVAPGRDGDDRDVGRRSDLLDESPALEAGQVQVEEDEIRFPVPDPPQRHVAVVDHHGRQAVTGEPEGDELGELSVVLDDEDLGLLGHVSLHSAAPNGPSIRRGPGPPGALRSRRSLHDLAACPSLASGQRRRRVGPAPIGVRAPPSTGRSAPRRVAAGSGTTIENESSQELGRKEACWEVRSGRATTPRCSAPTVVPPSHHPPFVAVPGAGDGSPPPGRAGTASGKEPST